MFKALLDKANHANDSETAKKIKKGLICGGAIMLIIGLAMIVIAFVLFLEPMHSGMQTEISDLPTGIFVAMGLFPFGGIISSIGGVALKAGVGVVIAGAGVRIAHGLMNKCPKCKKPAENDEMFCSKCGTALLAATTCSCGAKNKLESQFCKECGKKLNVGGTQFIECEECKGKNASTSKFCKFCGKSLK